VVAKLKLLRRVLQRWGESLSQLNTAITNCNTVILVLDKMEENRPLFSQEFNLRNIVKRYLLHLLNAKKEYWKKCYTVRWTRFGDEGTSFFHAAAIERYRLNMITSITTDSSEELTAHQEKAIALWEEYKGRLGVSNCPEMFFDHPGLVNQHDLHHLDVSFTNDDIDRIVQHMPTEGSRPERLQWCIYQKMLAYYQRGYLLSLC
jgi:hypothetical protein